MVTNTEYIKNGGDTLSKMYGIRERVWKDKEAATYKNETRKKLSKNKRNTNEGESKKSKKSKDGKRNG